MFLDGSFILMLSKVPIVHKWTCLYSEKEYIIIEKHFKNSNIYAFPQIKSKINSLTEFSYSLHCPNLGEQSAKICKEGFKLKLKP